MSVRCDYSLQLSPRICPSKNKRATHEVTVRHSFTNLYGIEQVNVCYQCLKFLMEEERNQLGDIEIFIEALTNI